MKDTTKAALNKRPWLVRIYLISIIPIAMVLFIVACLHQYMINIWEGLCNATDWIKWESDGLLTTMWNSFKTGKLGK